ncbi:MAG: hypothetical protein WA702_03920, partial [Bradyrhizobium sp.]
MAVIRNGLGPFAAARPFTSRYHEEKARLFVETLPYIAPSMSGTRDPGQFFPDGTNHGLLWESCSRD